MNLETLINSGALLATSALYAAASAAVAAALWRPLWAVLAEVCVSDDQARLLRAVLTFLFVVVAQLALVVVWDEDDWPAGTAALVSRHTVYGFQGLLLAALCVAVALANLLADLFGAVGGSVSASADCSRADYLSRLLAKVEEVRARKALRRVEWPEE
jgi:hypothetical protein